MPFLGATDNHLCEDCLKEEPSYVTHKSIFHYKGLIRDALLNYKFNNIFYSTPALADYLSNYAFSIMEENKIFFDYALGVPIHKNRLQMRTFNQSTLLAKKVSKNIGMTFTPDLIIKTRDTLPQTKLKAKERRENIKNAFTLNENILNQKKGFHLQGKNVLLIDDIYTTGSTINECSKVLTKAGANVYALTLARSLIL